MKTTDKKSKPRWELKLESQIKRLRQAGILKRNIKNDSDETEKARQLGLKKYLEVTNQNILAKERRLKRYRDNTKQYRQNCKTGERKDHNKKAE